MVFLAELRSRRSPSKTTLQIFQKMVQTNDEKRRRVLVFITIHMPQRTSKMLLVRLTANRNALLFLIRVTSFARYTV